MIKSRELEWLLILVLLVKRQVVESSIIFIKMVSTKTIDGNGNLFLIMMGFGVCTWELQINFFFKYILFTHYLMWCTGIWVFIILVGGVLVSTWSSHVLTPTCVDTNTNWFSLFLYIYIYEPC